MVVIIDGNEVSKLEMTSGGGGLRGNTLLCATITKDGICVVIYQVESWLVECGSGLGLSNSKTDSVGETLTERSSCDFHTRCVMLNEKLALFRNMAKKVIQLTASGCPGVFEPIF